MLSFYTEDDTRSAAKTVTVKLPEGGKAGVKVLDKTKNARRRSVAHDGTITLELRPNSVVYIDF